MVVEMQMKKERVDFMMNALRGRVSSDLDELVQWTDLPFTAFVTSFPLLSSFPDYAKRMQHLTPRRRTRKEPALKEEIKRGRKAAMP